MRFEFLYIYFKTFFECIRYTFLFYVDQNDLNEIPIYDNLKKKSLALEKLGDILFFNTVEMKCLKIMKTIQTIVIVLKRSACSNNL